MDHPMSRYLRLFCLLTFYALTAFSVHADTVTYTFEAPQFIVGELTPILNRSPNVGSPAFQASFVSPNQGGHGIFDFQPNILFTGQMLAHARGKIFVPNLLTITLNRPVNQVQFVWALGVPGRIDFTSSAGNQSQNSAVVGGALEGGTFSFSSATSFTSFSLVGFNLAGTTTNAFLAIDNLTLTTNVPEPASLVLLGTGLAALTRLRKRTRSA